MPFLPPSFKALLPSEEETHRVNDFKHATVQDKISNKGQEMDIDYKAIDSKQR